MTIAIFLAVLFATMTVGVPIAFALMLTALALMARRTDKLEALAGELEVRQERGRAGHVDDHDRGAGLLELGGDDVAGLAGDDGEGDERGRDVEVLEGARHAVLAADGGRAELELRFERAEERHERLAPAGRILAELFEILLERQARAGRIAAGGGEAGDIGAMFGHVRGR